MIPIHHALPFAALLAGMPLVVSADAWPNYRGPRHDGVSTEKLASHSWPQSGPRQHWRTPTPDGFSSLVVADGRVYTLVSRDVGGVEVETVVALDAQTARELWAYSLGATTYGHDGGNAGVDDNKGGDGPRSTPTVVGNRVYVLDAKLVLACLDAASGKEVWKRNILREHNGKNITWGNAASPVIDGDLIFMAGGGRGEALLGLDRNTGRTVWKGENDVMTHATPIVATLQGEKQVIFLTQSGLVSVRPADGEVLWRQAFPYNVSTAASPVVAGDIVYCSAGYGVGAGAYKISKADGKYESTELWRKPRQLENHWSTPVYHDGHLYGLFGFKEYGSCPLKCVELATGTEKWSKSGFGAGNVTLVDGHLIVLGDAGQLVLVEAEPAEYREKGRADVLPGKCWSTPTYAGGRIYVRSTTEAVCLDLNPKVASR